MSEKEIEDFDNDKDNSSSKSEKENPKTKQEYSKKIGNYVLLCEIGTGTFSKVAKAFHIITDQEVAVKILEKEKIKDEIDIERILREIEILKKVIHPNICQLYETYSTVHNFYIMMEQITGGDLFDYITNNNYLSENKSCKLFRQLISVIEYLNELGISHRDIKPENILLDDEQENLKLIDFGLSNYFSESKLLKSSCGSPCYASPEMLSGMPYLGLTTDLWSSGIVLYSMLVGSLPFDDQELYELYKQIKLGKFYLPSTLSLEAIDLLKRILNVDPDKRISLEGIKNHQWFKMNEYPLYKGIDLKKEKLGYNQEVIDYVMNNFFKNENENDLEPVSKNEFIDMVKNYCCNKYTATYYLTKKYILRIDDKDSIFKKEEPEEKEKEKEEIIEEKNENNINLKYDKKICKKNARDSNRKSEENPKIEINDKINVTNNYKSYIIKNDINLEIPRNISNNKNDENQKQNMKNEKEDNIKDDIEKKGVLLTEIDDESNEKKINKELFKNDIKSKDKLNSAKKSNKNERKKNYKKNELYLNNIKNTNLNPNFRGSIEIKQKKFTKNLLLKGQKTKENITSSNNINHSNNNSYIIKTWGNNSINHISKNNKIAFIHSGNNQKNKINYNNYFNYNFNAKNNNKNVNKKKNHETNSSINSHNKVNKQTSQKKNDKEKDKEKNKEKENNKEKKNHSNNSYNYNSNCFKNKYSLTSSKEKENNFNFYLINNYINQNDIKNNKNNSNLSNYHFGKLQNIIKSDDYDSNINFSQCYFIKSRKCNILKTIDLPGSYTSRYNTEANNKKLLNSCLKQYNKIKVNLKTDTNKFRANYSPKFSHNKKDNIRNKTNSLNKEYNNISNSVRKKNSGIKNIIINNDNNINLLSNRSVKKDNSNKNINSNTNIKSANNKIDYKKYIKNELKTNTNNKIALDQSGSIINQNLKNFSLKSRYTKKIPRKDSENSSKTKNINAAKDIKEHILNNINNNIIYRNSDIYNKKKVINCCTTKNPNKDYKFKELFPIEEGNKIFDIKCHFNTKRLKNKILLMNEVYLTNKCNSPKEAKEFYSFNDSGNSSVYHSVSNIINSRKNKKDNKMKQNFSNIYNRKKNLIIKTDNNISGEKGSSPQFNDKKIKYIYKSKLSLY